MEISINNTGTPTRPNVPNTLENVLWAISHMIENQQITRSAPALCNVLEDLEGFTSDDMCSLRQTILGHMVEYNTTAAVPIGLMEPVQLFEEPVFYSSDGSPMDNTPPFADQTEYLASVANTAPAEPQEEYIDFTISESSLRLLHQILDEHWKSNGHQLKAEKSKELQHLIECFTW